MGLAPISPFIGALPWATTAKGEGGGVVGAVVVAVAAAIGTATAVPYIGLAAFFAAPDNIIQNIAYMFHTKQYLYIYQYNYGWIYQPLLYWFTNICVGVDDGGILICWWWWSWWWRRWCFGDAELLILVMVPLVNCLWWYR